MKLLLRRFLDVGMSLGLAGRVVEVIDRSKMEVENIHFLVGGKEKEDVKKHR